VPVLAEAAALGRSVAFAWLIGPEELGRAMMLALTVRLVEMASDLGADRLMVQARDGQFPRASGRSAGCFGSARASLGALVLSARRRSSRRSSPTGPRHPLTRSWRLCRCCAVSRISISAGPSGCFRYGPWRSSKAGRRWRWRRRSCPRGLLGDHRAMAWVLIAHARRWCRSVPRRGIAALPAAVSPRRSRVWRFGAPLMLNAVLLFATFYADRLIVAGPMTGPRWRFTAWCCNWRFCPRRSWAVRQASLVLPRLRAALAQGRWPPSGVRLSRPMLRWPASLWSRASRFWPARHRAGLRCGLPPRRARARHRGRLAAGFRVLRTPFSQLAVATGRTGDPARANLIRALALIPAAALRGPRPAAAAIAAAAALGEAAATLRAWLAHPAPPRAPDTGGFA
jgi:hypothetical protein